MKTNGLNKTEIAKLDKLRDEMETARDSFEEALADFNLAMLDLHRATVLPVLEEYNDKREALGDLLRDWSAEAEAMGDEKSERWQESEKGEAFTAWQQHLEACAEECERIDPDEYTPTEVDEDAKDDGVPEVETEPSE